MLNEDRLCAFARDAFPTMPALYRPEEIREIAARTDAINAWPRTPRKWMMNCGLNADPGANTNFASEQARPEHP